MKNYEGGYVNDDYTLGNETAYAAEVAIMLAENDQVLKESKAC